MPSIQHTPEPAVFRSEKGAINGVASLDSNGLVPNSQLPGATQSAAGTMSAADKTKLDGIATGATANVVSDSLSDTSTTNALSAAKGKALNDSIAALNTQITPFTTNKTWSNFTKPTLSNGTHYGDGCNYLKIGCFVVVIISVQFDSAPSNVLLWTMPSGYIPVGSVDISASGGGSYNAKAQCVINSSGGVRVTSVDKWVTGYGIYVVAS